MKIFSFSSCVTDHQNNLMNGTIIQIPPQVNGKVNNKHNVEITQHCCNIYFSYGHFKMFQWQNASHAWNRGWHVRGYTITIYR